MTGTSQGRSVAWLAAFVTSCFVASGEVHGQGTSSALVDSVADLLEVSQPSRELIPTQDDSRFLPPGGGGLASNRALRQGKGDDRVGNRP